MAEIEFSALSRQCLDKRIGSIEQLKRLTGKWTEKQNIDKVKIHLNFTVDKARERMASQYATVNDKN